MAALRPTAIRALHAQRAAFRPTGRVSAAVKPNFQPHFERFTLESVTKWVPSLAFWGVAGGGAATLFLSGVPLFQTDVLKKLPIVASYFEDTTPDTDKPF